MCNGRVIMYLANDLFVNDSDVFVFIQHLPRENTILLIMLIKFTEMKLFTWALYRLFNLRLWKRWGLVGLLTSTSKYGTLVYWIFWIERVWENSGNRKVTLISFPTSLFFPKAGHKTLIWEVSSSIPRGTEHPYLQKQRGPEKKWNKHILLSSPQFATLISHSLTHHISPWLSTMHQI